MPSPPAITLDPSPSDSVSRVAFSPSSDHLLCSTWSGSLSLHSAQTGLLTQETRASSPILDACFLAPTAHLAAATLSGDVVLTTSTPAALTPMCTLGAHTAAARALAPLADGRLLSGGWDGMLRTWDTRTADAAGVADARARIYGACAVGSHCFAAITAARRLLVYDGRHLNAPLHDRAPRALALQLRGVSASEDGQEVVVGGTDGRVAVETLAEGGETGFSFRCHRVDGMAFPVNCVKHVGKYTSFATAGGDGHISFWDGHARKRIAQYARYPTSVASIDFDGAAERIAIAVSYTFEEGEKDHPPDEVHVRMVEDAHIATKQPEPITAALS